MEHTYLGSIIRSLLQINHLNDTCVNLEIGFVQFRIRALSRIGDLRDVTQPRQHLSVDSISARGVDNHRIKDQSASLPEHSLYCQSHRTLGCATKSKSPLVITSDQLNTFSLCILSRTALLEPVDHVQSGWARW